MSLDELFQNVELALVRATTSSEKSSLEVQKTCRNIDNVCEDCGKQFPNVTAWRRHTLVKHCGYRYVCPLCQFSCGGHDWFKSHLRKHSSGKAKEKEEKLSTSPNIPDRRRCCPHCDFTYARSAALGEHVRKFHVAKEPSTCKKPKGPSIEQSYLCDVCSAQFSTERLLESHKRVHSSSLKYGCEKCGRRFKWASSLGCHIRAAHSAPSVACSVCGKEFRDPSNCRTHEQSHKDVKRHRCHFCKKASFARRDHYQSHSLRCEAKMRPSNVTSDVKQ